MIVLGVTLLLASLNITGVQELLGKFWPIFLIALGAVQLTERQKGNWWPFLVMAIGAALLLKTAGWLDFNVWTVVWPSVVILIGLSLVFGGRRGSSNHSTNDNEEVTAFLGGVSAANASDNYGGARLTAIMGGVELDISKATIKKEAQLDVSVIMGGIELRVPDNVIVKSRATTILGGVEDKTRPQAAKNAPTLYLDGVIVMGGVEVKR